MDYLGKVLIKEEKSNRIITKFPFYYGYVIIFAGTIGVIMSAPGQTVGISVFTDFLIEDLKISRENLSLAYLIGTLFSSFLLTYAGKFFDKFGARITSVLSGFFLGLSLLFMSRIANVAHFFNVDFSIDNWSVIIFLLLAFGFFIVRFFGQGVLTMSSRNMVMKWFDTRRGLASAFMGVAISFGFSYSPRVFDWVISLYGWQGAWQTIAIVVGALFVIFAIIFFRDNPYDYGLEPDGKVKISEKKSGPIFHPAKDYTLKEARRTYSFWIFNLTLSLQTLYVTAFSFHVVDIFSTAGLDRDAAIDIFLPVSLVAVLFQITSGYLSDFIQLKYLLLVKLFGIMLSTLGLFYLQEGIPLILLITGFGISSGVFGVLSSVTWPRYFGLKHLGEISGYNMSWVVAGSAVGPFLFSMINDFFGVYSTAAIFTLIPAITLFILAFKANNVNIKFS